MELFADNFTFSSKLVACKSVFNNTDETNHTLDSY